MTKVMKIVASGLFVLTLGVTHASAEGKGLSMSGSVEAGYATTFNSAATSNGFLLDAARLNMEHNVSDSVRVVFNNAFSVQSGTAPTVNHNSSNYFSGATIGARGAGMSLLYSNMAAYVDFKCGEKVHTWIGHFSAPFSMEGMWDRYNMNTYYYSSAYTAMFTGLGWNQDLGLKLALVDVLPGTFEVAVLNDMNSAPTSTPSLAARWNFEMKSGDLSITPVVSAYFGNFAGPTDIGITGGAMMKMGAMWANAEFLYGTRGTSGAVTREIWGVVIEPGFDSGFGNISAKWEYHKDTLQTDMNLGAAISHEYSGGYRIKLAYNHTGLQGNIGGHTNDVRVLVGAKF